MNQEKTMPHFWNCHQRKSQHLTDRKMGKQYNKEELYKLGLQAEVLFFR